MAYYLEFDGVDDHVSVPQIELTGDFEIVVDVLFNSTQTGAIIGEYTASPNSWIGYPISQNTLMYLSKGFAGRMDLAGVQPEIGVPFQLRYGRRNNTTKFVEILGVTAEETVSDSGGYYISEIGSTNGAYFSNCAILSVKIYNSSGALIHHYDPNFTAETGAPYLVDTVGGNHGTPVGFADFQAAFVEYFDFINDPIDEGLRDNGLKLTTASEQVSLPLIGAYDVDVNYTDDTVQNYTGTGTLVLDGTTEVFIKSISGTDSVDAVFYDANQDAGTTDLPELLQGKDGTLIGSPAYEPIIPLQVYSIPNDYTLTSSNVSAMISAANGADERLLIRLDENVIMSAFVDVQTAPNHLAIIDGVQGFNGDFSDSTDNRIIDDTNAASRAFLIREGEWLFKNFGFTGGTGYIQLTTNGNASFDNVGFYRINSINTKPITIRNSVITGSLDTGAATDELNRRTVNIYNSTLVDRLIVRNYCTLNADNIISIADTFNLDTLSYTGAEINLSYSVLKDDVSSHVLVNDKGGNQHIADVDTAFADPTATNPDLRIRQDYANANLVGQGYLGSDIASAFYYTESGSVTSSCDFSINNPEFSALLNATLPSVSAEAAFSISAPELSGNLSATLPTPIANASFTIESPTFSADATTIDNPSLSGAFDIPSVEFDANASATLPSPNSVISFEIPSPDLQGTASAIIPVPSGMVEFDVDPPDFSGDMSATLPDTQLTGDFSIAKPEFNGFAMIDGINFSYASDAITQVKSQSGVVSVQYSDNIVIILNDNMLT